MASADRQQADRRARFAGGARDKDSAAMTTTDLMAELRLQWGDIYNFVAASHGPYTAMARFGQHDVLEAADPEELLRKIRGHYLSQASERSST